MNQTRSNAGRIRDHFEGMYRGNLLRIRASNDTFCFCLNANFTTLVGKFTNIETFFKTRRLGDFIRVILSINEPWWPLCIEEMCLIHLNRVCFFLLSFAFPTSVWRLCLFFHQTSGTGGSINLLKHWRDLYNSHNWNYEKWKKNPIIVLIRTC